MEEVLLEGGGDGGFARGGQAGEPDGEALLLAEGLALGAGEGRVPGDVAKEGDEEPIVSIGPLCRIWKNCNWFVGESVCQKETCGEEKDRFLREPHEHDGRSSKVDGGVGGVKRRRWVGGNFGVLTLPFW